MSELINLDKLDKAIEWFIKYVKFMQNDLPVDFKSGFIEHEEGYKEKLFYDVQDALHCKDWKESMIGERQILNHVMAGLNAKSNNIVFYQTITNFKKRSEEDIVRAEEILYKLYKSENYEESFAELCEFYGNWYPMLSYLFFMKDKEKYITVNNSEKNHEDRFHKLGIDTSCLRSCSWENYQKFLQIHREIQARLCETFENQKISLLDAHSFVWMLHAAPYDFHFDEEGITFVREIESDLASKEIAGKERDAIVKVRVNQRVFRERLLNYHKNCCCMCGMSNDKLLTASHIKPWSVCSEIEKLDFYNGFLLCPNHDQLFDQGWITFSDDGKIIISNELEKSDRTLLNVREDMQIDIKKENIKYMEYHRNNIFRKENNR